MRGILGPQYIGQVIGGAAIVFTLLAAALFVVLVFFARFIASLMQAPAEALDLTASYVRICGSGIFFIVAYNMLSALFRGLGDSRSPLIFVLVACIVNIICAQTMFHLRKLLKWKMFSRSWMSFI